MKPMHLIVGECKQWESGDGIVRADLATDVSGAEGAFASIKGSLLEYVAERAAIYEDEEEFPEGGMYANAGCFTIVCWLELPSDGGQQSISELMKHYILDDEMEESLLDSYLRRYWQSVESTRGEVLENMPYMCRGYVLRETLKNSAVSTGSER